MYGVVVLMALSTSAESPDFGKRGGCHGCSGSCSGTVVYTSCGGCSGSCHGGRHHREKGHKHSCHGCSGGCYGTVIYSCTGGVPAGCTGGAVHMHKADASVPGTTVTVMLPTAAQLVIDDYTVPTASDRHIYVANTLNAGETRTITFKAVINQETITRQVTITSGQDTTFDLVKGTAVAADRKSVV